MCGSQWEWAQAIMLKWCGHHTKQKKRVRQPGRKWRVTAEGEKRLKSNVPLWFSHFLFIGSRKSACNFPEAQVRFPWAFHKVNRQYLKWQRAKGGDNTFGPCHFIIPAFCFFISRRATGKMRCLSSPNMALILRGKQLCLWQASGRMLTTGHLMKCAGIKQSRHLASNQPHTENPGS